MSWTLHLGDCLDPVTGLASLGDKSVDAVVTDPPYGIGIAAHGGARGGKAAKRYGAAAAPKKDYGEYQWDGDPCPPEALEHIRRVSTWQVIFGGNYFALPPSKCWLVWDKVNGDNDFADCELAWTNLPIAVRRIRFMWNGMLRAEPGERVHPTQKPVGVMEWAISHLPEGATIVDPFAGSGTTGVAAIRMGRNFIGWERDPGYHAAAIKRLSAAREQLTLGPRSPSPGPKQGSLL